MKRTRVVAWMLLLILACSACDGKDLCGGPIIRSEQQFEKRSGRTDVGTIELTLCPMIGYNPNPETRPPQRPTRPPVVVFTRPDLVGVTLAAEFAQPINLSSSEAKDILALIESEKDVHQIDENKDDPAILMGVAYEGDDGCYHAYLHLDGEGTFDRPTWYTYWVVEYESCTEVGATNEPWRR